MNNEVVNAQGLNRFYSKVYLFFAVGLGISAVSATFSDKYLQNKQ